MGRKPSVSEEARLAEMAWMERAYWKKGSLAAGTDEAGRGPLAGPVVAAAVLLPPGCLIEHVNDSKKLSPARREKLYPIILEQALSYGIGWVWPRQIDEINILQATRLAFKLAYEAMEKKPDVLFVDGRERLDVPAEQIAVAHGDARCHCIAAASIIAKVERDRYMTEQDAIYPAYGFARHKGYGTARHIAALRELGPCPLHRRSFLKHLWG